MASAASGGEMNVPPSSEVEIRIQAPTPETAELLDEHLEEYLPAFTRFSQISIAEHQEKPAAAAVAVIGDYRDLYSACGHHRH